MEKIYRQVSVKDRLPERDGMVVCISADGQPFITLYNVGFVISSSADYWLEVVDFPNVSHKKYSDPDEDKYREHSDIYDEGYADGANDGYIDGFKEAIEAIKGENR
ncbi:MULTISPECIES: hypothetical protein [Sphingobacterium]|uniref:hypothetical protein n=1 Tax=Sphingobacterium TaxID=28453 RepID=UPI00257CFA8B|nr:MULTISPECIES: hypothetical protein [Sphingobacterium]